MELIKIRSITTLAAKNRPLASKYQKTDTMQKVLQSFVCDIFLMENSKLIDEQQSAGEEQNVNESETSCHHSAFFNIDDIRYASDYLRDCVVSFLDKNDNCCIIVCPVLFWLKLYKSYIGDCEHFGILHGYVEEDILNSWVKWYKFTLKCDIPMSPRKNWMLASNASILFKNKDTIPSSPNFQDIRVRIYIKASFKNKCSPFKKALQAANASIFKAMYMLQHKGMAMKKCQDLVETMQKKVSHLKLIYGKDTRLELFQYDIENFFTNVTIQFVLEALSFFITNNPHVKNGFWVHKRNKKLVFTQKPVFPQNFFHLSNQQLVDLVTFDMENCIFKIGKQCIMKQLRGLSIGGYLSSALAIMLANYAEHKSLTAPSSRIIHSPLGYCVVDGIRITDDGLIIVALHSHQNMETAVEIKKAFVADFEMATGHSLNLVFSDLSTTYDIFENTVINIGSDIIVRFNVKNYKSLRETGKQIIKKGISADSAVSSRIKVNLIMNTFMRIRIGSSFDIFCIASVMEYIYEILYGYQWSRNWVVKAINKTRNHHSQSYELWTCILRDISCSKLLNSKIKLEEYIDHLETNIDEHIRCLQSNF